MIDILFTKTNLLCENEEDKRKVISRNKDDTHYTPSQTKLTNETT